MVSSCSVSSDTGAEPEVEQAEPIRRRLALKLLKAYRRFDVEALAALRVPPEVESEVESVMRRYTRFILEREARSLAFVDEVRHTAD